MARWAQRFAAAGNLLLAVSVSSPAVAEKPGGILRVWLLDSPASLSIHEEATVVAERPVMAVFNNLVIFDQHVKQNSFDSILPELAKSWSWSEDGTELTFALREGVKWHDGKPFTAADVKCTWDLLTGKSAEKLRINPRKIWYANLDQITTNGGYEVTFHLKRPQPAFIALLASGMSPVYPCHVSPAQMRQHPIGTQSGLLEIGSALTRRDRIHDCQEPFDGDIGVYCWQIRLDLRRQCDSAADAGHPDADALGYLRIAAGQRQHQSDCQPHRPAFRQSRIAASNVACDRPQGLYRHPDRRHRPNGSGDAAAPGRPVGHAKRNAGDAARV
jgi:hypothetical protein